MMGPEPFCGVGASVWKEMLNKRVDKERQILFSNRMGLRQSKLLLGNYNRIRSETCIRLSRNNLRLTTGLLTGHCAPREHLFRMGVVSSPTCRFCYDENASSEHILGTCGALMHLRKKHLGAYQMLGRELSVLTPSSVLKFVRAIGLGETL